MLRPLGKIQHSNDSLQEDFMTAASSSMQEMAYIPAELPLK